MIQFPKAFFVTGTDTGIGKTLVSAILLKLTGGTYWKPVQSGTLDQTDTAWVRSMTLLASDHFAAEAYTLTNPLSPHASARIDGVTIDLDELAPPRPVCNPLIVEGAGGVMVPLNDDAFVIDLIQRLQMPVVLVARSTLGTINHTLLTLQALRARGIEIFGVVLNGELNEGNRQAIEQFGKVNVLACLPPFGTVTPSTIDAATEFFKRPYEFTISYMAPVHANADGRHAVKSNLR